MACSRLLRRSCEGLQIHQDGDVNQSGETGQKPETGRALLLQPLEAESRWANYKPLTPTERRAKPPIIAFLIYELLIQVILGVGSDTLTQGVYWLTRRYRVKASR